MKKIILLFSFLFLIFVLTGCGKQVMMDELNKQGFYPYSDSYLGFNLSLTKEFKYYQFERDTMNDHTDLAFFVPTADTNYPQRVPGYAEPIIVRIYDKTIYEKLSPDIIAQMTKVGEKNNKVYSLIFWGSVPSDWQGKWTDALKQQLIKNFSLR